MDKNQIHRYRGYMGYDYDKLYRETPDALGAATEALAKALARWLPAGATVLDVGCGQGRDALPLARAGHRVTGVDLSPHGVADMQTAAKTEGLDITGVVADLTDYTPAETYDAILIDRTLHMLDEGPRHACLARLAQHLAPNGLLFLEDEKSNIPGLRDVLKAAYPFEILKEKGGTLIIRRT